jgi:NADPH:quinone reductase-like Zn-dependent oxidoreductase
MDETILKIILAVFVGGLIGAEREFRIGTGLSTMMLVCLGSTLFTIYSDNFAFGEGDPRRIATAVVTGVGFLAAGQLNPVLDATFPLEEGEQALEYLRDGKAKYNHKSSVTLEPIIDRTK